MSEFLEEYKSDIDAIPRMWKAQLHNLETILWETGAYVVFLGMTRREDLEFYRSEFTKQSFRFPERLVGETLSTQFYFGSDAIIYVPTGAEIEVFLNSYLGRHPGKKYGAFLYNYCIISSKMDMLLTQRHYFLLCDEEKGLTETIANKAIKILNHEE